MENFIDQKISTKVSIMRDDFSEDWFILLLGELSKNTSCFSYDEYNCSIIHQNVVHKAETTFKLFPEKISNLVLETTFLPATESQKPIKTLIIALTLLVVAFLLPIWSTGLIMLLAIGFVTFPSMFHRFRTLRNIKGIISAIEVATK
jgi:hypothetical protein